jgi:hypothetical protein
MFSKIREAMLQEGTHAMELKVPCPQMARYLARTLTGYRVDKAEGMIFK